jgi:hypothetical protein
VAATSDPEADRNVQMLQNLYAHRQ